MHKLLVDAIQVNPLTALDEYILVFLLYKLFAKDEYPRSSI